MEIRLLGPLEVVVDGGVGTLPGAGERALLAVLALRAGRVVSADALVDALWGDELPARPANALQTRVSKLRRALTGLGADGSAVATVAPGYRLDVAPEAVDALRVEAEIADLRRGAPGRSVEETRARYAAALGAWRGPALADVGDVRWAETEARRLDELRVAALEERIRLDLDAGRHAEVVGELEALVGEHPLHEGLHGLLMIALYRSGRQADALAAYQRTREALDRELGLDPSVSLRELEAAVLRQDPLLAPPSRVAAAPPEPPPPVREPAPEAPQVVHPGGAGGRAGGSTRGGVPARVATVVGRDDDVAEVTALLDTTRLLTVTGPGGAGKTTLALEAARRLEDDYASDVWFVDLAAASQPSDVAAVVADTLRLPPADRAGEGREALVARQLRDRRCLLVLDNCEHLVDACAALVARVLAGCPEVRVLATSREALAAAGEVQYALAPLPLDDAVELFAQRARAADRAFALDDTTRAEVADLCARLDGMPLAVELAAARVRTLPVAEITARLADRFGLLRGGSRTAAARHQTLRATVDWSHQLLSEPERILLRRLSVFPARWSLSAAEEVCAGASLGGDAPELAADGAVHGLVEAGEVLDLVERLVDRSLVVAEGGGFRLLETIRAYAGERLAEAGEHEAVTRRQVDRLLRLAETCEPDLRGAAQRDAVRRLSAQHADLRAALAWCAEGGDVAAGQRLAGALGWFWFLGDHGEGRRLLRRLLDRGGDDAAARGRALQALAIVDRPGACVVHPSAPCAAAAAESVRLLEAAGEPRRAALSRVLVAVEGVAGDDPEGAEARLDEAAGELVADPWATALVDFVRMEVRLRRTDPDAALALGDRAATAFTELGDVWGRSAVRAHQGHALRDLGRLPQAADAFAEALDVAGDAGLWNTVQYAAAEAGFVAVALGDEDGARRRFDEAAAASRRIGDGAGEGLAAVGHGHLARRRGDLDEARSRFESAVAVLSAIGSLPYLALAEVGRCHTATAAGDLAGAERAHREVLAAVGPYQDPVLAAAARESAAGIAALRGDHARAAAHLGAAAAVREAAGSRPDPLTRDEVERVTAVVRAALGEAAFAAAVDRGRVEGARRADQLATS